MRIRHFLVFSALVFVAAAPAADEGFVKLFNGKDLTGWTHYLQKGGDADRTWSIKGGVIHCTGTPAGYLITEKEYGDYTFRVQWRWPAKPGNSGIFVHVSGPDKIWPRAVEAQLQHEQAGDFWLVDGYKMSIPEEQHDPGSPRHYVRMGETFENKKAMRKKSVEKPLGEWNQYEVTCKGDEVRLTINGTLVNVGTKAESKKGKILLQSEGSPIDFKEIEIKMLK